MPADASPSMRPWFAHHHSQRPVAEEVVPMPSPIGLRSTSVAAVLGLAMLGWSVAKAPAAAARGFKQVNLVADTLGMAAHTDPDLLNPWGMTFDSAQKAPPGFAPFGIHDIDGRLYVTFAMQDANREDDVKGDGHGFIDIFDTEGRLLRRFASGTAAGGKLTVLDSPWGMALAPRRFGRFGRALLVGNFGSGHIVAFDRRTA